jgi:predicted ATPase
MVQAVSSNRASSRTSKAKAQQGITAITVQGYKSIQDEVTVSIAPLTILSGANSSGKSSLMQPILLMKQTLQAPYDPGALLLSGPNLKFTSAEQLFTHKSLKETTKRFKAGIEIQEEQNVICTFQKTLKKPIDLLLMEYEFDNEKFRLSPKMTVEDLMLALPKKSADFYKDFVEHILEEAPRNLSQAPDKKALKNNPLSSKSKGQLEVARSRCFFEIVLNLNSASFEDRVGLVMPIFGKPATSFEEIIQDTIHVPGLRGNPERTYKTTAIGKEFPGTFENYVASIINHWQNQRDANIKKVEVALQSLGLTSKIEAKQIDDTQVELKVGRLPCTSTSKNTKKDMVSIADVGFGVSQTLPVIVALLTAKPGQLVYIEQPEIHLHPRAQVAIAEIFADAANRGVRVVVETHSELFLMGIQALVAEGKLTHDKVKLHWFSRQENGTTKITTDNLDETGAFGNWPEDFSDVSLSIQNRYLSAAEAKLWQQN